MIKPPASKAPISKSPQASIPVKTDEQHAWDQAHDPKFHHIHAHKKYSISVDGQAIILHMALNISESPSLQINFFDEKTGNAIREDNPLFSNIAIEVKALVGKCGAFGFMPEPEVFSQSTLMYYNPGTYFCLPGFEERAREPREAFNVAEAAYRQASHAFEAERKKWEDFRNKESSDGLAALRQSWQNMDMSIDAFNAERQQWQHMVRTRGTATAEHILGEFAQALQAGGNLEELRLRYAKKLEQAVISVRSGGD